MLDYMQVAVDEAVKAAERGEVPVGAALVGASGELIAKAGNRSIELSDPSAHAEIMVLRQAANSLGNYRLCGVTLYVTLEPCIMCMGAMIHARIHRLVFAASDPKTGAVYSRYQIGSDGKLNHDIVVEQGEMAEHSSKLLRIFFKNKRSSKQ